MQTETKMINLKFSYYVSFINAAGMTDCEKREHVVEFGTDDTDQAFELADRQWVAPANYMDGSLQVGIVE